MHTTSRTRSLLAAAALATIATTAGCAADTGDSAGSGDALSSPEASREAPRAADDGAAADRAESGSGGGMSEQADGGAVRDAAAPGPGLAVEPALIATGTVSLEAEDVGAARFDVRRIVDEGGGAVTEQETTTDEGEVSSARLVLRVPSERFEETTAALEDVATLTSSTSAAQDVTAEVVDVEARIRAQRKSVERVEALLARAETIQEVVSVESQLASRQAELDSLVARQNKLADQTSLSTITVYIEQVREDEQAEDEDKDGFLGGLADGWDAFVGGVGGALLVVGFLLPWALALALVGVPLWLVLRRRRRAGVAPAPAADVTPSA